MRYGKYCGVKYTGCPGEAPCDALDACCMIHDACVKATDSTYIRSSSFLTARSHMHMLLIFMRGYCRRLPQHVVQPETAGVRGHGQDGGSGGGGGRRRRGGRVQDV